MEARASVRVPRQVWLAAALAIVWVLLVVQNRVLVAGFDIPYYRVIDARTIGLGVAVAPCSWTRVTGVTETASEVRVKVETWPCLQLGPGTAALVGRELTVSLQTDLGDRVVEDANGKPIPRRQVGETRAPGAPVETSASIAAGRPKTRRRWVRRAGRGPGFGCLDADHGGRARHRRAEASGVRLPARRGADA